MLRNFTDKDKDIFIQMSKEFYSSPAVVHNIDPAKFEITFNEALNKNPFLRAFIIEKDNQTAGYALLTFTYSSEVAGMVVLVEELFIMEQFRSHGLAREFFKVLRSEYTNAKRFRLEVTRQNKHAISLYESLGYKTLDYIQMIIDID